MDPVELFADKVAVFAEWAAHGSDSGAQGAQNGLIHLTELYLAGMKLPASDSTAQQIDGSRVSDEEWNSVYRHTARLPLDFYSEVFNPLPVPSEKPVTGSLADDIADIYRDVVTGLNDYREGHREYAVWRWTFYLDTHWGEHITGAIRALQCWLSMNAPRY